MAAERVLWDAETIADQWPTVAYDDVMASDEGVHAWLRHVATYGFCMVTGTPPTIEATRELDRSGSATSARRSSAGSGTSRPNLAKADTAYTNIELLPHTDGTYSHDAPGLQLLHCLAFDGEGGLSTMVDGFRDRRRAARHATRPVRRALHRRGAGAVHRRRRRTSWPAGPCSATTTRGELVQVSFNNADRAPFLLPADEMDRFYEALRAFEALANDHRLQWRRLNPPGEAMLFDNWRVLHGRTSYTGHRHLCGAYVNREDYESRLRLALADR